MKNIPSILCRSLRREVVFPGCAPRAFTGAALLVSAAVCMGGCMMHAMWQHMQEHHRMQMRQLEDTVKIFRYELEREHQQVLHLKYKLGAGGTDPVVAR